MSALPDEVDYDYLVYSASSSFAEQAAIWESEYLSIAKWMLFKKFDNFIDYSISERYKAKNGRES